MTMIKARVTGRRLELDVPSDWPDGTEVEIQPLTNGTVAEEGEMLPDEVARLLAMMDRIEPLELTDAERAAWESERQARKNWEKSRFAQHSEKLNRM